MQYVLITGSREYGNAGLIRSVLGHWVEQFDTDGLRVIVGDAKGPDAEAHAFFKEVGVTGVRFKAQWDVYGNSAGFRRNTKMAEYGQARQAEGHQLCVVAFWDGVSKGTGGMIELANSLGIPVFVVDKPVDVEAVGETVEAVVEPV